jgi:hypothetical protein
MNKSLIVAAVAAALTAVGIRRRRTSADAAQLWRDATADASR